jgi:hydroxymethylglutaryl-CoA synthase
MWFDGGVKPSTDVGLLAYGVAIPRLRLDVAEVARVWRRDEAPRGRAFKAVAAIDEDACTLAIEAARHALRRASIDPSDIGAVWVGSESKPYAVKPTSTIVADAAGALPRTTAADFEFACKAGTEALQAGFGFVASGMARAALCIGADTAQGRPGDALEETCGAGAAALIVGPAAARVLATLEASTSFVSNTADFFRREGREYPAHGHRFTGEPAYFSLARAAAEALLGELGRAPKDYRFAVFHQPNRTFPMRLAESLGFTREQSAPHLLVDEIGNPYAASSLLAFCAALDDAQPGDRIFLCSYGSGAGSDAFSFAVTEHIGVSRASGPSVRAALTRRHEIDYARYARERGKIRSGDAG